MMSQHTPSGETIQTRIAATEQLQRRLPELMRFATVNLALAEVAPDRMTVAQSTFFLFAALADLGGHPSTFTEIRGFAGERIGKTLHTTYKVLLEGSRRSDGRPDTVGMGWLVREVNPNDERHKLLRLTAKGRLALQAVFATEQLQRRLPELMRFTTASLALAELAPERMTTSQTTFFLIAALADLEGRPSTFTEIRDFAGERIGKTLHTTYRVLLEGSRRSGDQPDTGGAGWLVREVNPHDRRQKFLHLTDKGRRALQSVSAQLKG